MQVTETRPHGDFSPWLLRQRAPMLRPMDGELAREHHIQTPDEGDFARIVASMVCRTLANPGTSSCTLSHSPAAAQRIAHSASSAPCAEDHWLRVAAAG